MPQYPMPLARVEVVLQSIVNGRLSTLLVKRSEPPYKGRWALPGGVIRVDLDASLDSAAARVIAERLQISPQGLRQLLTVGGVEREPRAPSGWGLSVVYRAMVREEELQPVAGKRVEGWAWHAVDVLPAIEDFAFDHKAIVQQAAVWTRAEFEELKLSDSLVPSQFTLGELQLICESVLGRRLDKSSFRRKLKDRGVVAPIEGAFQSGMRNRPAGIYRLTSTETLPQ